MDAQRFDRMARAVARAAAAAGACWPDSRDRLRSPEHELARRGVTWASDPAHDLALARQLAAARARRPDPVLPAGALAPATGGLQAV
ncbi:MAG: hypothetical protein AVDCRST_MAG19-2133 [uncultured Thermomicrobiales bacterium]|uniref:Uncharacterized protein n=1 Tax=uncultured Thermomicrobiales bacterium TaxID=1645740 RepID=A0A6J4UZ93_9BACT|nr:MAG: hypothetical protein AVDCRST_MAG19-2133 [uncultured Thermomicrobiales bacterium]